MSTIANRYDFIMLFDVKNGNPNGDPDAGNLPRIDPETGNGIVTDVCIKRKIRNYVELVKGGGAEGYEIYVREKVILNQQHERAYAAKGLDPKKNKGDAIEVAREWMCQNFYDVRAFGAVMSTGKLMKCGQVRGPVQLAFGESVHPIVPREVTITRMAVTTEKDSEAQGGGNRTMGRKYVVPYGLYRMHGFVSAPLAEKTGFSDTDLELLWEAIRGMFEQDHSASRGEMTLRRLIVFKHDNRFGNAAAHQLFGRVAVKPNKDPGSEPLRGFEDYSVTIAREGLPEGISILEMA